VAVITVALHTVLWAAVTPLTAAPAIDLVAVICLSETSPAAEQHRSTAHLRRHTCDYGNLCSAAAPPLAAKEVRLALDPPAPGS
jgi:hypothetical protein